MKKSCIALAILFNSLNAVGNAALPILPAEVLGRDLDVPKLGGLGHVGITMAVSLGEVATFTVETLNDPHRVVQVNWINDFKSRSPYWGSRYGIAYDDARTLRVLREANSQRCLHSEYTLTTIFWPATGDLSGYPTDTCKTFTPGKFRCDTFMIYVFSVGDYYVLKSGVTLPKNVFASFPYGNGDGPYAFNNKTQDNADRPHEISDSLNMISADELQQLSFSEFTSVIDTPENYKKPNIDKKIWNLYKNLDEIDKRVFLLDYLGGVAKPNFIPILIEEYNQNTNPDIKHQLLVGTQSIYSKAHLLQSNLAERERLISFYIDLLKSDYSKKKLPFRDAKIVATGLTYIASNKVILDHLKQINSIFERAQPYDQIGYKCNLMLDLPSLEDTYIPQIIELLTKENDRQLDERFFSYIKDALSKNIDALPPHSKILIRNYLNSVDYKFNNRQQSLLRHGNPASMFSFGAWLEASALVNSETHEDAAHYIAEFLKNKPTEDQANYIIGLSQAEYLQRAFKTEQVFRDFVAKNKQNKSAPVSTEPKQKMINAGIQYSVDLIEGHA
ncbi:hypothetical protein SC122_03710 [Legionella pneumophila serogroup 1]|nr:hypothetical protein [Legionella pneumophila]HAT7746821.1 hypothetical protein [Legionella pneumophila]HAT7759296.1 hypothetical protein [Legionella pneumophila]HAU2065245.1 hypothetical protein [Legionella pneumophila]